MNKIYYNSRGKHKSKIGDKISPAYDRWRSMCRRCYDPKVREKQPSYRDTKVCEEWLDFQNFAEWFEEQKRLGLYQDGWELDKDVLSDKDNKIYSPETCCFLPRKINGTLERIFSVQKGETKGYSYHKRDNVFNCRVRDSSKTLLHIGYFSSEEQARDYYIKAKIEILNRNVDEFQNLLSARIYESLKILINSLDKQEKAAIISTSQTTEGTI